MEKTVTLTRTEIVEIFRKWEERAAAGECGGPVNPETSADFFITIAEGN